MADILVLLGHLVWDLFKLTGHVLLVYYAWHGWKAKHPKAPPTPAERFDFAAHLQAEADRNLVNALHRAQRRGIAMPAPPRSRPAGPAPPPPTTPPRAR